MISKYKLCNEMYFKKPVEKKPKYLCTDWIFCNFSGILPPFWRLCSVLPVISSYSQITDDEKVQHSINRHAIEIILVKIWEKKKHQISTFMGTKQGASTIHKGVNYMMPVQFSLRGKKAWNITKISHRLFTKSTSGSSQTINN